MSSGKAALKAINDAIRAQKFDDAVDKAQNLVKQDASNFQGCAHLPVMFESR